MTKQQRIYEVLLTSGPLGTADIAALVHDTPHHVSAAINELRRKGCVSRHNAAPPFAYAAVQNEAPQDRRGKRRSSAPVHPLEACWPEK